MAINPTIGTFTSVTVTGLSTLASAAYAVSNTVDHNSIKPIDVIYELTLATTNTPAGNKRCLVFLQVSIDGTNFSSPSTVSSTDEQDLYFLGTVWLNSATTTHRRSFSVAQKIGFVPYSSKVVIKNDLGVALTSGSLSYANITIP